MEAELADLPRQAQARGAGPGADADFRHLQAVLHLRAIRAVEHWRGNTHLTMTAIIMRALNAGAPPAVPTKG